MKKKGENPALNFDFDIWAEGILKACEKRGLSREEISHLRQKAEQIKLENLIWVARMKRYYS